MAVVISELEVIVGSDAPPAPEETDRPAAAPALRPEDINAIVERHLRLLTRVLAH